jgi:uncharacterized protein (DUF1697 family)
MPRLIAFLRAINVGGNNVKMTELVGHFAKLGLKDAESFIASGNIIFTPPPTAHAALAEKIEKHLTAKLGYEVPAFLRTESEVAAVAAYRPFTAAQFAASKRFNVAFLAEPLDAAAKKAVLSFTTDIDDFHVNGREVYWLCKVPQSDTKFSNAPFERALKRRATWRGVQSVQKLVAKFGFTA